MDRDEFERLKQAEKEHLRTKKQLKRTLHTLKRKKRIQNAVTSMAQRARDLLRENESLVNSVSADAARAAARMDLALDRIDAVESIEWPDRTASTTTRSQDWAPDVDADEEELEARAEQIVQQMKMASGPQHRRGGGRRRSATAQRPSHPMDTERSDDPAPESSDTESDEDAPGDPSVSGTPTQTLPEKTIGRMTETDDAEADSAETDGAETGDEGGARL